MGKIILGDNMSVLPRIGNNSVDLIYIDPPFNTGINRKYVRLRTTSTEGSGDRLGFQGREFKTMCLGTKEYPDKYDDYLGFLTPRLTHAHRILKSTGSFFLHLDYREVHYVKILLDEVFGRDCFVNDIVWAYDYGARSKTKWSTKHDNILWYVKNPKNYTFNFDEMDRIPYMAPGMVTPEKAARGKTPTDVWWHTIVPTNGKERTGYPTQKPIGVLSRIIKVHSNVGDLVVDFFAGSGTTGEVAARLGRDFILVDSNSEAARVMKKRLKFAEPLFIDLIY